MDARPDPQGPMGNSLTEQHNTRGGNRPHNMGDSYSVALLPGAIRALAVLTRLEMKLDEVKGETIKRSSRTLAEIHNPRQPDHALCHNP
jgi:hypothetical protein